MRGVIKWNNGKWFFIKVQFLLIEPTENPTLNCSAGARGTGGICDCTNAIGWIEGQWWKPWCNEGLCNTGQDYKECIGKADGHKLGDDTWCWKERRNTQCQTTQSK